MHRLKLPALVSALAAILLLGTLASAASAALPEFSVSKYPDAVKLSGGHATLLGSLEAYSCTSSLGSGKITGPKEVEFTVTFNNCANEVAQCYTKSKGSGKLESVSLKGTLGYISKEAKTVGIVLNEQKSKEKGKEPSPFFVEPHCRGVYEILGGLVVAVPSYDTNKTLRSFYLEYKAANGKQTPASLEGGLEQHLSWNYGKGPVFVGLSTEQAVEVEKEIDITA